MSDRQIQTGGYSGPERREASRQWHLDRSVSVGHLLTTFSIVIAGFWFIAGQEERISLNEQAIKTNQGRIERAEADQQRAIDKIDSKLDRIFEYIRDIRQ